MSVAWALGVWANDSWVGMNGGPPNAWRGDSTPVPAVVITPGGGDSTRFRRKGKRPMYYWEAARLKKAEEAEVQQAAFDAVAVAYTLSTETEEFQEQLDYIEAVAKRLRAVFRFHDLATQLRLSLDTLRRKEEDEENELVELIGILDL